jgi:hypothetical protein
MRIFGAIVQPFVLARSSLNCGPEEGRDSRVALEEDLRICRNRPAFPVSTLQSRTMRVMRPRYRNSFQFPFDHPARRLALCPFHAQLSRHRICSLSAVWMSPTKRCGDVFEIRAGVQPRTSHLENVDSDQPIEIGRGRACFAFGSASVSTPSSSCALIFSWSILFDSVNDRA